MNPQSNSVLAISANPLYVRKPKANRFAFTIFVQVPVINSNAGSRPDVHNAFITTDAATIQALPKDGLLMRLRCTSTQKAKVDMYARRLELALDDSSVVAGLFLLAVEQEYGTDYYYSVRRLCLEALAQVGCSITLTNYSLITINN
jgi:hypothetical protein